MNKRVLSKKVLSTLLTMSCVYLGGTPVFRIAEAAPVEETSHVRNENKVYEDGSSVKVGNDYAVWNVDNENTTVRINDGTLTLQTESNSGHGTVVAQGDRAGSHGTITFIGDTVNIINNNTGNGNAVYTYGNQTINFENERTKVSSAHLGLIADSDGHINVAKDLEVTVTGQDNINYRAAIIASGGGAIDVAGNTVVNLTAPANGWGAGVRLYYNDWNGYVGGGTVRLNTADITVQGGNNVYGVYGNGEADRLDFAGVTTIKASGALNSNTGVTFMGAQGELTFNDRVNIEASGGTATNGVWLGNGTTGTFIAATEIRASSGTDTNFAVVVDDGSILNMRDTLLVARGGEIANGLQLSGGSQANFVVLGVNAVGSTASTSGINIIENSMLKAQNISVLVGDAADNSAFSVDNGNASVTGHLDLTAVGGTNGRGLSVAAGRVTGRTVGIRVSGDDGTAFLIQERGEVNFSDRVWVDAATAISANGGTSGQGSVRLENEFISAHENSVIRALNGAVVDINALGAGTVQFQGTTEVKHDLNNPAYGIINLNLNNQDSYWNLTGNSTLTDLKLSDAIVDMRSDNNGYSTLSTAKLSGNEGVIKQDIDVRSMESDKVLVSDDFSGSQALDIYQKDNYIPAGDSTEGNGLVLASVNGNGTFTAKDREGTLFYTHYDLANKASETAGFTTDWYLNKIIKTDEPTTSVDTVLSANALNYHTWRTENDKLLQRMSELRHNGEEAKGAWVRMQGSKIGREGKFGFENKYTAYELGYDQVTKKTDAVTRYQGAAISYADGSSSYSSGSGDNSNKAISFYDTQIGSKGHYLDLVFKISNMDNDFTVYDTDSNKITGDFNNTGVALSAEYGRKNDLKNGWYIEPQAQFTLGYLGGDNYVTSNGIEVNQSGIKSAVGRIGFNIGKQIGSKGLVYAKANLLHEFGGGYDVTMTDSSGRVKVSDSFNDTWFEYGVGAALAAGKNSQLYFDVERSAGSAFKKDWQWNVGARWTF